MKVGRSSGRRKRNGSFVPSLRKSISSALFLCFRREGTAQPRHRINRPTHLVTPSLLFFLRSSTFFVYVPSSPFFPAPQVGNTPPLPVNSRSQLRATVTLPIYFPYLTPPGCSTRGLPHPILQESRRLPLSSALTVHARTRLHHTTADSEWSFPPSQAHSSRLIDLLALPPRARFLSHPLPPLFAELLSCSLRAQAKKAGLTLECLGSCSDSDIL